MAEVGRSPEHLDGVFVTHEHRDHILGLAPLVKKYRLPVYINRGTWEGVKSVTGELPELVFFDPGDSIPIGDVVVKSFPVMHDAADPVSFAIHWSSMKVGIAQDLGYADHLVKDSLQGCSVLMLECNHDPELLLSGPYPWSLKQRILGKHGHLSNQEASEIAGALAHSDLRAVFATHLSEKNNHPNLARSELSRKLGSMGMEHVSINMTYPNQISSPFTLLE